MSIAHNGFTLLEKYDVPKILSLLVGVKYLITGFRPNRSYYTVSSPNC
jgi:hypothetical protein